MDDLAAAIMQIASCLSAAIDLRRRIRRWSMAALGIIASALLLAGATGCGLAALWIGLLPVIGPVWAPLATAAMLLALAFTTLALSGVALSTRPMASPRRARRATEAAAPQSSTDILIDALRLFEHHKDAALVAAVISGISAGRRRD